jgi:toxin ParE1/3/4
MRPALVSVRARRELAAAVRWIARDNKSAAVALNEAVKAAATQIGTSPQCGRSAPEIVRQPYRLLPLTGFPYILIYNPDHSRPSIVRIVHGARDLPMTLSDL